MNYIIVKEARELAGWKAEREALSVYEALEKLEDKRRAQGKRYSLALLLTCILLGKRRCRRSPNGCACAGPGCNRSCQYEVGQVFCLRRRVHYPLKCTQGGVYGFTSLTPKQAGTVRLLGLIREHWAIEIV